MFVLTVDQQRSTRDGDKVPVLLDHLAPLQRRLDGIELPFERTVGDEVQAVVSDPAAVLQLVLSILRLGGWRAGVGVGPVGLPLPAHSREASGLAFVHARAAVDKVKGRTGTVPVAMQGERGDEVADAQAVLHLLGALVQRRSAAGWAVVDLLDPAAGPPLSQRDVAARLGISEQAVSQRVRAALWPEELAARPLATRVLRSADPDLDR